MGGISRERPGLSALSFPLPFFTCTLTPTKSESVCGVRVSVLSERARKERERMAEGDREGVRNYARSIRRIFNNSVLPIFHREITNDSFVTENYCLAGE